MNQKTYRTAIERTWNDEPPGEYQPANAALGIVGELHEYVDNQTVDELGDLVHYVTTLRRLLDFPVWTHDDGRTPAADNLLELERQAGETAELTKKWVFHGDDTREALEETTREMMAGLSAEARRLTDEGLDVVRQQNVEKLEGRYPDGFEPADTG